MNDFRITTETMKTITRRHRFIKPLVVSFSLILAPSLSPRAAETKPTPAPLTPVPALEREARRRVDAKPRVALAAETSDVFKDLARAEPLGTARVPNYLRALAPVPQAVKPFAHLVPVFLYGGAVAPEVKAAMGLRVAQVTGGPYVAAHVGRVLNTTERGRTLLGQIKTDNLAALPDADRLALSYAETLTRDVNGVGDADFRKLGAVYNDSQLVELTMTVAFFNYFTRLSEALNLPVEAWALETAGATTAPVVKYQPPPARVALISDEEIGATNAAALAAKDTAQQRSGLGLGMANSQRAMLRAPDLALAWRAYGGAVREHATTVNRETKLHVSFAVSMANGCHYCTLHQVLGLRRLGVDPAKLVAMKKDDAALDRRERTAVEFARKLTRDPAAMTDGDYEKLRSEFGEGGALEVVLQTCAFNFMNRFTDALRLPSEDEAIRVYEETYGRSGR